MYRGAHRDLGMLARLKAGYELSPFIKPTFTVLNAIQASQSDLIRSALHHSIKRVRRPFPIYRCYQIPNRKVCVFSTRRDVAPLILKALNRICHLIAQVATTGCPINWSTAVLGEPDFCLPLLVLVALACA
jgi:hypothetical protein